MAKYYSNKIADLMATAKNAKGIYEEMQDVTSFELPEFEYGEGEVSGAGIIGTINIPDLTNIESPEAKVKSKSLNGISPLFNPNGVDLKLNWAVDYVNDSSGKGYHSYTAYVKGISKNIPGGEKTKGESEENEVTISVTYYKLIQDGITIVEYNPLAGILKINGVDVMEAVKKAVGRI